jgi:phage-related protein (TIGR01555 family)
LRQRFDAREQARARAARDFFKPPETIHPPSATPPANIPKLAMDDSTGDTLDWAQNSIRSVFAEGLTFLGYAHLSQLAQRPEYRRASEIIAEEMTRKWIKIQSVSSEIDKTERIKELNDALDRFKVRDKFRKSAETDGFFGRAHLYIDTGSTDDRDELRTDIGNGRNETSKLKFGEKGFLRAFRTVEPVWCYPTNYNSNDPLKDDWYRPDMWYVLGKEIHRSRLLKFESREVPDLLKPAYSFGGLSLSQMGKPYVDNWLKVRQGVSNIITAFSVFVLKTNMAASLQQGGEDFFERLELFVTNRDNQGVMAIDKDTEDFGNVSAPLGTLDALQSQTQEHMCAIWGIPAIKYLNIQPAGFNASSEGEINTFENTISAAQERFFRPNLTTVIDFVMLDLWGEVDQEITFKFESLKEPDEEKQTAMRKTDAETDVVLIDAGVISPEESRKRVAADEDSPYSSIDVSDMPEPPEDEKGMEGGEEDVKPELEEGERHAQNLPSATGNSTDAARAPMA